MKKKVLGLLIFILLLSGCGTSYDGIDQSNAVEEGFPNELTEDMESVLETEGLEANGSMGQSVENSSVKETISQSTNRKLIKTVQMTVETKEFDNLLHIIENQTNSFGGYIEQLYSYNGSMYDSYKAERNASLTLRIPKDKLDDFLKSVGQVSNVIDRNETVEDVTLTYVDMESRKKVLFAEEERLLEFLNQAKTIEEMISIESRLSQVRYEIESMESQLRTYDNKIDYSTVYMEILEVAVLTPVAENEETAWQRISDGFMENVESIINNIREGVISFLIASPYLIFAFIIIFIITSIIIISLKIINKKQKHKVTEQQKKE